MTLAHCWISWLSAADIAKFFAHCESNGHARMCPEEQQNPQCWYSWDFLWFQEFSILLRYWGLNLKGPETEKIIGRFLLYLAYPPVWRAYLELKKQPKSKSSATFCVFSITTMYSHHLYLKYYVSKIDQNELCMLKIWIKSWEPFWICLRHRTDNPAYPNKQAIVRYSTWFNFV